MVSWYLPESSAGSLTVVIASVWKVGTELSKPTIIDVVVKFEYIPECILLACD